jgi:hypothetical protein
MTIADSILALIERKERRKRRPSLTAQDIAEMLYGPNGYQQLVDPTLRELVAAERLDQRGEGGPDDPFTYHTHFTPVERRD